jgi:glycine/D-amino acid oxidase-like deaminating enzyme
MRSRPRVAVIGAGAFGGWAALELVRRGAAVTLIDAWGPGHARASSGGETRIIRAAYGSRAIYTRLAARALDRWRDAEHRWRWNVLRSTGGLWIAAADETFVRASAAALEDAGRRHEWLTAADVGARYPQIDTAGVLSCLFEPDAGYLFARRACELVVERAVAEGGACRIGAAASPVGIRGRALDRLALADGTSIQADVFVFACGPWLGSLFPDVIGERVTPTRQEVYYFGAPAGDRRFDDDRLPVWVEIGDRLMYGIPGNANRGFKIADDTPGPVFDPTSGSRQLSPDGVRAAQDFLARRFPALHDAPFLGGEVCQYEASPDSHLIVDVHPEAPNVWLAGGGSGHGFKMGPAIGEILAAAALGRAAPDPAFALARFASAGAELTQEKWR